MDNITYEQLTPILQSLMMVASLAIAAVAGATATYARFPHNQHVWFKLANIALFMQAVLVGRAAIDMQAASVTPVLLSLVSYLLLRRKSEKVSQWLLTLPREHTQHDA